MRNTCVRTVKRCNKKNRHAPRGTIDSTRRRIMLDTGLTYAGKEGAQVSRCRMRRAAAAGEAVAIDRTKATRCQKRTCVATRGLNKRAALGL